MKELEKLGAFCLDRGVDPASGAPTDDLLLVDARDLTTHAVCAGMTGSGKTGPVKSSGGASTRATRGEKRRWRNSLHRRMESRNQTS